MTMESPICFYFMTVCLFFGACKTRSLPTERLRQYSIEMSYRYASDSLFIFVNNTLHCPIRVGFESDNEQIQQGLTPLNPLLLAARADTSLAVKVPLGVEAAIRIGTLLGDPSKEIKDVPVDLPFVKDKKYKIIQGNNSRPTHDSDWSRYALDFNLAVNDTICAASDGYIVGVIDGYFGGGEHSKWRPYGNFITIYHPSAGVFTQYVHLVFGGSLVTVGDHVEEGQPIGLSGKTGQTNIEHLHFNYLVPTRSNAGLRSYPFVLKNGKESEELTRGDVVIRTN